ncbi:hypothetical protein CsSME_00000152 [Camellia sinensis var. sinensis]
MGMWKHRVDTPSKLDFFRQEFEIPADVNLRLAGDDDSIMPTDHSMPFPVVAFIECRLRFPLDPFFRQILHFYKLNPMQLAINSYRVITADLPDSNKGARDDYFIVSGNWEFQPNDNLHLYPLSRTVLGEGADVDGAKSPLQNEKVLDLTQDEEGDEVSWLVYQGCKHLALGPVKDLL